MGMKPLHLLIPLKPCQLFAGISSGIAFHPFNSFFKCPCAVQISEHFFISHRIKSIVATFVTQ